MIESKWIGKIGNRHRKDVITVKVYHPSPKFVKVVKGMERQRLFIMEVMERLKPMMGIDTKLHVISKDDIQTAYCLTSYGMVVFQQRGNLGISEVWLTSWELTALHHHEENMKPDIYHANIKTFNIKATTPSKKHALRWLHQPKAT